MCVSETTYKLTDFYFS